MDMNAQRSYGFATGQAEGLQGIEVRRERYPYVVEEANESGIAETTNGGINQFPVHEPYPMNQHYFGHPVPGGWPPEVPQNPQHFEAHEPRPRQDEGERPQQHFMQRRAPRRCQCKEMKEQLLETKAANEALRIAARDQKMELFESWKSAGEFNKAGKYYEDLLANDLIEDADAEIAAMILNLKQSYVDMLIKQGERFQEAGDLAEEVWDRRKNADPVSDISKESHRHLCSIYASLKRLDEAERMHKLAYEEYKGREDAWALENGDECCKQLAEQHKYEEAALMQAKIWTERQKVANGGPRHPNTIKSGKSRISLLENLSVTLADQAGSESEKNLRRSKRETCEHEIDQALQYIWDTAESPERETEILDVGHKLGDRLLAGKRFSEAEAVLDQVWQGRKLATNEADPQAMSTGRILAAAIKLQGSTERYERAATIYWQIWKDCKHVFGQGDDETISVGIDLGATLYHLGQYSRDGGAEEVYGWVLEQRQIYSRQDTSTVVDARYSLGRAMYCQGQARYAKATELLQDVYDQWYERPPPDAASIHECGHMLVEIYKHQKAVEPLKALFEGRKRLETRDILYLESGYAYGRLLVEKEDHGLARKLMRSLWEYEPALVKEKEFRLRCGRLYGQILLKFEEYNLARDVLQAVVNAQNGVFNTGTSEVTRVSQLLGEAQRNIRGGAKPRRRANVW